MTISFYINKNNLQELSYLEDNYKLIQFDNATRNKAIEIECFNSLECVERKLYNEFMKDESEVNYGKHDKSVIETLDLFIQVNIEYLIYNKIQEYLKF